MFDFGLNLGLKAGPNQAQNSRHGAHRPADSTDPLFDRASEKLIAPTAATTSERSPWQHLETLSNTGAFAK